MSSEQKYLTIDIHANIKSQHQINPRPVGVCRVTRPVGGGGRFGPPYDLRNYWADFQTSNANRKFRKSSLWKHNFIDLR